MGGGDYGDNCFNHRTDADGADDENVNKDDGGDEGRAGGWDGMAVRS